MVERAGRGGVTDDYHGLSASRMKRTTYSLGARGKDDLGELDRCVVLVTSGTDLGEYDMHTEFVAWGIDPPSGHVMSWGLMYRVLGGSMTTRSRMRNCGGVLRPADRSERMASRGVSRRGLRANRALIDSRYRPEIGSGGVTRNTSSRRRSRESGCSRPTAPGSFRALARTSRPRGALST